MITNRIINGDCRDVLRGLAQGGGKVQCVVTSPPYWALRDYGHAGQLGLEPLHDCLGWATGDPCGECHVCHMVEVFRLVRDLLADDGTCWINYGDSYASSGGAGWQGKNGQRADRRFTASRDSVAMREIGRRPPGSLKPKDLCGIPWRVALALQADGWYLRQDIIWHKPNPMPESVTDRCTKAHEYLFLLSKSARYYFDNDAIKEDCTQNEMANGFRGGAYCNNETFDNAEGGKRKTRGNYKTPDGWDTSKGAGGHGSFHKNGREKGHVPGNKTHKGTTAYEAGAEEHRTKAGLVKYAEKVRGARDSFMRDDSKRAAVIPGQSVGTHRPDRAESEWDTARRNKRDVWTVATQPYSDAHFATFPPALIEPCILAGSRLGDIVLDPFGGSGTTAQVAQALGRKWILCELQENYAPLIKDRTRQPSFDFQQPCDTAGKGIEDCSAGLPLPQSQIVGKA